ncbi:unnamed protein product [Cylindrotheca closterium]|uniref:Exonuclease domain-containing protein n=1 Tax=Cylindrotheca closterium TaxID=2856 RepID=A0AAD2CBB3_9STRA|nr:unnamed protein product [Cylindrotheca closterium]
MAIQNNETEVTVIGVDALEKRGKRRQNRNMPSSDDSACNSDSSLSSSSTKPRRRRRRTRKTKASPNPSSAPEPLVVSLDQQIKYVALDCEMVGCGYLGRRSSVARVTLVDWNGNIIFDEFVKQSVPVTDYRTFVSGITEADLEAAKLTFDECRAQMESLLDGKILVGHALKNDLKALNLKHPWQMTRDTAKYEPFMQTRFDDGVLWPRKLKELAKLKLQRDIQIYGQPHSAYEDAMAAFDLYKKHIKKWEKVMEYKISKTKQVETDQVIAAE